MSKNLRKIPFVEIEERVLQLGRAETTNDKSKVRGIIQDIYLKEIPRKFDWSFLIAQTSLTLKAKYDDGYVTGTTGSNALTFSAATTLTSDMTGRKIKISGNDYVYDFTMVGVTDGTVSPLIFGEANPASATYDLFQPKYSLPADFDRFPKGGGIVRFDDGKKVPIPEEPIQEYFEEYSDVSGTPESCRLVGEDTMGHMVVEFIPAPELEMSVEVEYIKQLKPLRATSAGLLSNITAGGTVVTGNTACKFTEANSGDYFRVSAFGVGADSEWYRIHSIQHDSQLTLQTAFANTGVGATSYCISSIPDIPEKLHDGLIWGTLRTLVGDHSDPMYAFYHQQLAEVMTDGKKIYVTRIPNQEIETINENYQYRR